MNSNTPADPAWQELQTLMVGRDDLQFVNNREILTLTEGVRGNARTIELLLEQRSAIFSYRSNIQRAEDVFWNMPRGNFLVEDVYEAYTEQRNSGETECKYEHICRPEDGLEAFKHFAAEFLRTKIN